MMHLLSAAVAAFTLPATARGPTLTLEAISTVRFGPFLSGAAEIVSYDPKARRLFVVDASRNEIHILSIEDPAAPERVGSIELRRFGGGVNSVAVRDGLVAATIAGIPETDPGRVVLSSADGAHLGVIEVGILPDMVAFTPNGRHILTANEGQPSDDYMIDPEGSVSIIDLPDDPDLIAQAGVRTADFRRFNDGPIDLGVRVFGPGASAAQDLEPEYIAVSPDSTTAFVTLQENNALAVIDLASATVTRLIPLGVKDHSRPTAGLDASDRGEIEIAPRPVFGLYQPDTIHSFLASDGNLYLVCADEGDTRAYGGFDEVVRVKDLELDAAAFPDAKSLRKNPSLGRLQVTRTMGDDDEDGRYERLYAFGGRGFSIRSADGAIVFESGDDFERITAERIPRGFNTDNEASAPLKNRSDNRGPEPEALAVGRVGERDYAFIGLERTGGVMIYDITVPVEARFVNYWTNRDFDADERTDAAGDLGPECLLFIKAADSPTGEPLLVSANEVSATVTVHRFVTVP